MTSKLTIQNNLPGHKHLSVQGYDPVLPGNKPDGTATILGPGGAVDSVVHKGRCLVITEVDIDVPPTPGTEYRQKEASAAIARVCHEVNRAYCMGLGDFSQPAWDDAPQWQKDSAINGVNAILNKPETNPRQSHESWMKEKVEAGWVYGEKKDPEAKTHPCIVPYDELPREQQMKDHLFGAVVRGIMYEQMRR